jgi:hypothetical protein
LRCRTRRKSWRHFPVERPEIMIALTDEALIEEEQNARQDLLSRLGLAP